MVQKPEVFLEEIPKAEFGEYLKIFVEAREKGTLGKVIPPKTMRQMLRWNRLGTTFFYVRNKSLHEGVPAGKIVGVCGVSQSPILKRSFQIINQYILPDFRKKHFSEAMLAEQDKFAIKKGAKKLHAFLFYFDKGQYARFRNAGYKWGHLPSVGHLLKHRLSGRVRKKVTFARQTKPARLKGLFRRRK